MLKRLEKFIRKRVELEVEDHYLIKDSIERMYSAEKEIIELKKALKELKCKKTERKFYKSSRKGIC